MASSNSPDPLAQHSFQDDQSPSPSALPIDIPGSSSYSAWDDFQANQTLAYTPSYGGSFGSAPEHNWGDREATAAVYGQDTGDLYDDKYEPEGYTNQSPYLVMDSNGGFQGLGSNQDSLFPSSQEQGAQIQVSYQDVDHYSPRGEAYGAPSPGSSIGLGGDANAMGQRSRGSSVSSNHGTQTSPYMQSMEYAGQPLYDHFTKLNFDTGLDASPSWNQSQLPALNLSTSVQPSLDFGNSTASPPATDMSPNAKPMSPPQLVIPNESPSTAYPPGQDSGPQPAINLVPATPISGGGASSGAQLPFQQMLANLTRNRNQSNALQRGNSPGREALPSFQGSVDDSAARAQADAMTWSSIMTASSPSQAGTATASAASAAASGSLPQSSRVYHHGYNVPLIPDFNNSQRNHLAMPNALSHSRSDPTVPSSTSAMSMSSFQSDGSVGNTLPSFSESSLLGTPSLLNRNRSKSDTASRPPLWLTGADGSQTIPQEMNQASNYASTSNFTFTFGQHKSAFDSMLDGQDLEVLGNGDVSIRRAASDSGRSHKRGVKSEDLSSTRGPRLVPTSNSDFIRSVTAADGSLAPIDPRIAAQSQGVGPLRRRGSGGGMGHERNSSLSSMRSTPYQRPSPHTSPGVSPHHSPGLDVQSLPDPNAMIAPAQVQYVRVERPLVTTPATKTASANRRRAEASFVCPVPNCGSTFTRHFNLRGHLRSHNEERPFKCKWTGCEKGFARQHDCKRHEALHLNIRPYTCDGCQKTFARMDALNRHLRSEGGVDCQRVHQPTDMGPDENMLSDTMGFPKIESESAAWTASGALVM